MNELMKSAVRISLILLALSLVVWIFVESWRPIAAGFGAGTLISLANENLLRIRVKKLADNIISNNGKHISLGFGARTILVLIGALVAQRFPDVLNLPSILAGSFIVQFTMLPVALWYTLRGRG